MIKIVSTITKINHLRALIITN